MAYRVLVYDRELKRKVYAFGEDRTELRFSSLEALAETVHPQVGHDKRWPYVYLPEQAPAGKPATVPLPEQQVLRTFRRLAMEQQVGRRFKRLGSRRH